VVNRHFHEPLFSSARIVKHPAISLGYNFGAAYWVDSRMPEQLLDCHYIRHSLQEPGCKRAPQRMLHHSLDAGFSARQSKTRLFPAHIWQEVNEV
jgi:hypothetical protein